MEPKVLMNESKVHMSHIDSVILLSVTGLKAAVMSCGEKRCDG